MQDGFDFFSSAKFACMPMPLLPPPQPHVLGFTGHRDAVLQCFKCQVSALVGHGPDTWHWPTLLTNNVRHNCNSWASYITTLLCVNFQDFWHYSAQCPNSQRCVRCGDGHPVSACPRPRSDPVCVHCSGPHHAAYRHCPVRLQMQTLLPPMYLPAAPYMAYPFH